MSHHIARMEDLAERAQRVGYAASRFLTPAEADEVTARFGARRDISLVLDGGFSGAERTRAIFLQPDWGAYEQTELLAALRIDYRRQDAMTHRDLLGALMALGIERDTVGDILVGDGPPAALICLPTMADFLAEQLTKAGRVGLRVSTISLEELPARTEELQTKTGTVASLRLDAVAGLAFTLSRGQVGGMIDAGLVSLNHLPCQQPAKEVPEGGVISVRGMGRAVLLEIGGSSRKGRIFVTLGLYPR